MPQQISILGQSFYLENCAQCKVPFAMNAATYIVLNQRKENGNFYCPHGHPQHYITGESELSKMQREASRLRQRIAERDDELEKQRELTKKEHLSASSYKGKITRLKNRAINGVCPCCNRTFINLARHMETKHKDFVEEAI